MRCLSLVFHLDETTVTPEQETAGEATYRFEADYTLEKGESLLIEFIYTDGRWLVENVTPEECC